MAGRRLTFTVVGCAGRARPWLALASPAGATPAGTPGCSAGAHTLAPPGSHLYPDTGNGGYASVHTLVHLVYDATTNMFLPGNRVVLTDDPRSRPARPGLLPLSRDVRTAAGTFSHTPRRTARHPA